MPGFGPRLPRSAFWGAGGLGLYSFLPLRDPNGKGLPFWPPFNHSEQYLEISPVPQVSQKLRKARMQFWAETLPTKIRQWQQKQKGRKAQEEL